MTLQERLLEDVLLMFLLVFRVFLAQSGIGLASVINPYHRKHSFGKKTDELKDVLLFGVSKVSYSLWERVTCLLPLLSQNNYLAY